MRFRYDSRTASWLALTAMFAATIGAPAIHARLHQPDDQASIATRAPAGGADYRFSKEANRHQDDCPVCSFLQIFHSNTVAPEALARAFVPIYDAAALAVAEAVQRLSDFSHGLRAPPA